jgi:hypothetical protein
MKDYEQRVVVERDELQVKLEKLRAFLGSPVLLIPEERSRLQQQEGFMQGYLNVLNARIVQFASQQQP